MPTTHETTAGDTPHVQTFVFAAVGFAVHEGIVTADEGDEPTAFALHFVRVLDGTAAVIDVPEVQVVHTKSVKLVPAD